MSSASVDVCLNLYPLENPGQDPTEQETQSQAMVGIGKLNDEHLKHEAVTVIVPTLPNLPQRHSQY